MPPLTPAVETTFTIAGASASRRYSKLSCMISAGAIANVKGVVTANDGTAMTVTVNKASGHAKACKGVDLTFDVSEARIHSADNEPDGDVDAMDVLVGHEVKVRTKLALLKGKKTTCSVEGQTTAAKAVHNRTTPKPEEAEETETEEVVAA